MRKRKGVNVARVFRALAVEKRVEIVQSLARRTLCVGALANLLRISTGAVSQHLRVLKDAGLIRSERRGYYVHYQLAPEAAKACRAALNSLFARAPQGRSTAMPANKSKCQRPKQLKGRASKCSKAQIRKCHGDVKKHPCTTKRKAK